jgi:hypothetical protein
MLKEAWEPVLEYDTWVGVFGIPELREQRRTLESLKRDYGIEVEDPAWLRYVESDRVLQQIRNLQRQSEKAVEVTAESATGQFFWPMDVRLDRFQKLVDEGVLEETGEGKYILAGWENWGRRGRH